MVKGKRAVSPIISTVLLVMLVIVLASVIILWSKGFIKESLSKEIGGEEKEINQVCSEISASAIINGDGTFGISNNGNVPIYALNVKLINDDGSSNIETLRSTVNTGQSVMIGGENYKTYFGVKIIPIILGVSKSTQEIKEFTCPDKNSIVIK